MDDRPSLASDPMEEENALSSDPEYRYAGFSKRLLAFILDLFILQFTMAILLNPLGKTLGPALWHSSKAGEILFFSLLLSLTLSFFVSFFYYVGFWIICGSTPGKKMLGLKVLSRGGGELSLTRAVLRFLGYGISLFFLWGFLRINFDSRKRGWPDQLADSYVLED